MTPQEQEQLNKLLKEGIELAKKLNDTAAEASLKNFTGDLKTAELAVGSLRKEWEEYTNDIKGTRLGFARIVDEIKNMNSGVNKARSAFSGLSSIAAKLQSHQEGINNLSAKELSSLKSKIAERVNDLKLAGRLAKDQVEDLEQKQKSQGLTKAERKQLEAAKIAHANITQEISKGIGFTKQLSEQVSLQLSKQQQVEKSLGLSGALMRGMSKIPFLGDLPGMEKVLGDVEDRIKKINEQREKEGKGPLSRAEALKMTFGGMKGVIKNALTDPLAITGFLVTQMIDAFKSSDKATGDLAKNFNMTYDEASKTRNELIQIGNLSGDSALNARALQESLMAVGNTLGTNAKLNEADLKTFTKLREQAGFNNEELASMQRTTLATGGNLEDNTASLMYAAKTTALNNKVLLNEKDIMRDVAKASDAVKLSLAGNPAALGKAAAQAKALGMSLEQVDKIAGSLLDFEQSISSELEAELLTGKDLNLEQARLYAINNDMEGLSREIAKNFGSAADFSKMNRLQQEAAAKAVGMSREELAKTLTDQEALKNVSKEDLGTAQAALAAARARGMSEEEIAKTSMNDLMKQQDIQERLNNSVEKLKEIFVSIAQPIMAIVSPIVDLLLPALSVVSGVLSTIVGGPLKSMVDGISKIFGLLTGSTQELGFWEATLGSIAIIIGTVKAAQMAISGYEKLSAFYAGVKAAAEKSGLASLAGQIAKQAILTASKIAAAVAEITGMSAVTLGVAAGIALAAGAAAWAFLGSKKADDMVSPGYGQRTLMGPEGAIALNDKDTVIAGTNLFGKGDDTISEPGQSPKLNPAGSIKAAPSAPASSPSIDYNALANAMVSALNKSPMNVHVEGKIDGQTLIRYMGRNTSDARTEENKYAAKTQ